MGLIHDPLAPQGTKFVTISDERTEKYTHAQMRLTLWEADAKLVGYRREWSEDDEMSVEPIYEDAEVTSVTIAVYPWEPRKEILAEAHAALDDLNLDRVSDWYKSGDYECKVRQQ